jgi:hypothetical protein
LIRTNSMPSGKKARRFFRASISGMANSRVENSDLPHSKTKGSAFESGSTPCSIFQKY